VAHKPAEHRPGDALRAIEAMRAKDADIQHN
jgi:hypothetical protein